MTMRAGERPSARRRINPTPYLFLLPALVLFLAFRAYPLFNGLWLSLTNARLGRTQYVFVGLANYERLLHDSRFLLSLINTAYYTVASTLPILALPLLLAVVSTITSGRWAGPCARSWRIPTRPCGGSS
ncbi:MAG: sugar ABC transporter permease [candidate division NC10 bacterium]|nr:sugar ABC transporter permease [candidate division NC10 bacterium]